MKRPHTAQDTPSAVARSIQRLRRLLWGLAIASGVAIVIVLTSVTAFFTVREARTVGGDYAADFAFSLAQRTRMDGAAWSGQVEAELALLQPAPSTLDLIAIRVEDRDGRTIAMLGAPRGWLVTTASEPIVANQQMLGRVHVDIGIAPALAWTSASGVLGLIIAAGLLLPLRYAPFRIAEDALRRLTAMQGDLETQLRLATAARDEATTAVVEMRLAQNRALHAESRLRDAVSASTDAWFIYDRDFRLVMCSNNIAQMTQFAEDFQIGLTYEEIMRRRYRRGLHAFSGKSEDEFVADRLQTQRLREKEARAYQRKDGHWFLVRSHPLQDGGFAHIYTDFTDLKIAEQRALQAEQRLNDALNNLADGFRLWDADDRLVLCNRAFKSQAITLEGTVVGRTFEEDIRAAFTRGLFPSAIGREEAYIRERVEQHRRADGTPVEIARSDGRWFEAREHRTDEGGIVQIRTDITQHKRHERELQDARDTAEHASRAKSEFLSRMSHDLRTPLNAVLGFAQILLLEDGRDAITGRHREAVETIERTGRHLLEMVEDILDLSRIENQAMQLAREQVAVKEIVREVLSHTETMASSHGAKITVGSNLDGLPGVLGDRRRVIQVLTNLLSNAIKYGRSGGDITLDANQTGSFVRFAITDRGPGIAPHRQAHLFQPFNRAGAEQSGTEGTGIGLTIAKGLVEQMGGTIGCDSAVGQGSTFWFTLPVAAIAVSRARTLVVDTSPHSLHDVGQVSILYVEDTVENRNLVRRLLGRYPNVRYLEAESGEQGIELARRERPDIILMDMRMPGMSGLEALKLLRADTRTKDLAVIALTGAAMPHEAEEINAAGFDGYVVKPFRIGTLLSQLVAVLERRTRPIASHASD